MKPAKIILIFIFCFLGCYTTGFCKDFYVDNDRSGVAGSGESWDTAWKSFGEISWNSISPGDTIYISGGTTSKTYNERLVISKSGTSENSIMITKGKASPHNGKVIIDSEFKRGSCIDIQYQNYIHIKSLTIKGAIDSGSKGQIYLRSSKGSIVENCHIINERAHGGIHLNGYPGGSNGNMYCIIKNNIIEIPNINSNYQTDGIYSQLNTGNIYENNRITIANTNTDQHCDCIQCYKDTDVTIRGNFYFQNNQKGANSQGVFIEDCSNFKIYNNIGYGMHTTSSLLKYKNSDGSFGGTKFYNNTVIGGKSGLLDCDDPDCEIKNNIFLTFGGTFPVRFRDDIRLKNMNQINNNIYYCSTSSQVIRYSGKSYTLSGFQSTGADLNSAFMNPNLEGIESEFRPSSNIQNINFGVNLTQHFTTDKDGHQRPPHGAWSVGPYQTDIPGTTLPKIEGLEVID